MEVKVQIIDLIKPPLNNGKFVAMLFDVSAVAVNKQYKFQRDQDLNSNIITGIDVSYYSATAVNVSQQYVIGGKTFNTIVLADLAKATVTFKDKNNKILLRSKPLSSFRRDLVGELQRYKLDIESGICYITFNETPLVTTLPMIIPFNFFWD